jgi:hypothetical protein
MVFLLVCVKGRENFGDFESSFLEFREYGNRIRGKSTKTTTEGSPGGFLSGESGRNVGERSRMPA